MYTIILVSAILLQPNGKPHQVGSQTTFITHEACELMAAKMTEASSMKHKCVPIQNPRSI